LEGGPPVFPPDFSCPAVLWIQPHLLRLRLRGFHALRQAFPGLSADVADSLAVRTPKTLLLSVWPLPLSLATTRGISVDYSSSPYLDVSVQAVPPAYLFIQCAVTGFESRRIAPFGHPRINAHLRLPVAFRSLSRPSSAPGAKAFPLRSLQLDHVSFDRFSKLQFPFNKALPFFLRITE
jgi:hypothetical protein